MGSLSSVLESLTLSLSLGNKRHLLCTPVTALSSSFPRTVLHLLFFYDLHIELQSCTEVFLLIFTKQKQKREKILQQMTFSTPLHHDICLPVSGESVDISEPSSSPASREACSGKSRPSPGTPPVSQLFPPNHPCWPPCSKLKHLWSPHALIPCSSSGIFLQSRSFSVSNSCLLNCYTGQ